MCGKGGRRLFLLTRGLPTVCNREEEIMRYWRILLMALMLAACAVIVPRGAVYGAECVEYDYDGSYVDEYGFLIIRFYSVCAESRWVRVCILNPSGGYNQYSVQVPGGKAAELNVGKNIPDQTFYWTDDGSDPCIEE